MCSVHEADASRSLVQTILVTFFLHTFSRRFAREDIELCGCQKFSHRNTLLAAGSCDFFSHIFSTHDARRSPISSRLIFNANSATLESDDFGSSKRVDRIEEFI